jgi:hypothetical protein
MLHSILFYLFNIRLRWRYTVTLYTSARFGACLSTSRSPLYISFYSVYGIRKYAAPLNKLITEAKLDGYNNTAKRTPSTVYLKGKLSGTRPCRRAIVCSHSMPCGKPQLLPSYIQGLVHSSLRATRIICHADVTSVRCISTGNCCGDLP